MQKVKIPKGLRTKQVSSIPKGYIGMNYHAANSHHLPFPYPKKTILVLRKMGKRTRKRTIRHEKVEYALMEKGKTYKKAHKTALKMEEPKT
jgi:hypothetical protein